MAHGPMYGHPSDGITYHTHTCSTSVDRQHGHARSHVNWDETFKRWMEEEDVSEAVLTTELQALLRAHVHHTLQSLSSIPC